MTDLTQLRLTSLQQPTQWHFYLASEAYGWYVRVSHTHVGGCASDCPSSTFERLTTEEVWDVLASSLDRGCPTAGPPR